MNIQEALKHPDKLGAGAKLRRKLSLKDHFTAVMKEFKRKTLWSGSGHKVGSRKQALRIAFEEIGKGRK